MPKVYLNVKASTWNKESFELFDYDTKNLAKRNFKVTETTCIYRENLKVSYSQQPLPSESTENSLKIIGIIHKTQNSFLIKPPSLNRNYTLNQYEDLWMCTKGLKSDYRISEGDVIRLGRVSIRVLEISGFKKSHQKKPFIFAKDIPKGGLAQELLQNPQQATQTVELATEQIPCRICLSEESSTEDPLIKPCQCSGTMAVVHLSCLGYWLRSKVSVKRKRDTQSYLCGKLECELCKQKFSEQISIEDQKHSLISINKPEDKYLVLEALNEDQTPSSLHVVSLRNKKYFSLGRSHRCDVKLSDISVSREHSYIRVSKKGLYFEDNNSKFGSLVKVNKPIAIQKGNEVLLQAGKTLLNLSVQKKLGLFSCFGLQSKERPSEHSLRDITQESVC